MSLEQFKEQVRQYVVVKDEVKFLSDRENEIKQRVIDSLKELGEEDSRGHIVAEVNDEKTGISSVVHQKRISKSLDMDKAETILTSKGIKDRCIKLVPTINEDEIMAAYYEGLITEQEVDEMFPAKVSYALYLKNDRRKY
jgi:hypothetical protein